MSEPKTLRDHIELMNQLDGDEVIPTESRLDGVLASLQRELQIAAKISKERESELKDKLKRHEGSHYLSCILVRSTEKYTELLYVREATPGEEESGLQTDVCERFEHENAAKKQS
jgi:hypothetical protein